MKKVKSILFASVLLAAFVVLGSFTYNFSKKATSTSSVSGGGSALENGSNSTFIFNAVRDGNGSTHGQMVYHFRGGDISIHMDIDCLSINGNMASLSGTVSKVTGTNIPAFIFVGQRGAFAVEDNGNGGNNDKISDVLIYGGASCLDDPAAYITIQGNITIRE